MEQNVATLSKPLLGILGFLITAAQPAFGLTDCSPSTPQVL